MTLLCLKTLFTWQLHFYVIISIIGWEQKKPYIFEYRVYNLTWKTSFSWRTLSSFALNLWLFSRFLSDDGVIYYICAKYGLDCPVVTLDLSGSLPGLNKSHMQILMEVFRPFISHPLAGGKVQGGVCSGRLVFQTWKKRFEYNSEQSGQLGIAQGELSICQQQSFKKEWLNPEKALYFQRWKGAMPLQCVNMLKKIWWPEHKLAGSLHFLGEPCVSMLQETSNTMNAI